VIARAWHGVTDATKSDQYLEYLTGIPDVGLCGCPDVTVVEGQSSGWWCGISLRMLDALLQAADAPQAGACGS
jgi:hypothetical protein